MKHALKDKPIKEARPIFGGEIMENPAEQNSENSSGVPVDTKAWREKMRARFKEEIHKIEEHMGG
jgi:hypothetical protein